MKIKKITIQNFRKLKDISFETVDGINTIVGPNGIGKSSILDSIRLIKAVLLSNIENEANQTLQNMGLYSPHLNNLLFENICGDHTKETVIDLKIQLSEDEIKFVKSDILSFNFSRLQNQLGQNTVSRLNLVSFLSTPAGLSKMSEIAQETETLLKEFEKTHIAQIRLTMGINNIQGLNGFHQEICSFVFKSTEFSQTLFSVFPADRNMPTGDANIQLGQNDVSQQIQSYSIQPQLKFNRLKAAIISFLMINSNNIEPIQQDFKLIFDGLLPGKEFAGINLESRTGRLSVLIREITSGVVYDIDFLSSGEKGLLLTLFLLLRTVEKNGIVLLDEPELHLNPAVCQNIIPFLKKHICENKNVQIILTTHSSEILANTKDDESSRLLHLINESTISPIYKKDNEEAQHAIKCLGIGTADLLFNKGVVYLEGTTDDEFINEILKGLVSGFKIQSLGGRTIVENEIKILQEADKKNELQGYHVFVLDLDNRPSSLKDTLNVKIIQWDRYSFENYLLNLNVLYDVVKSQNPKDFPGNRAEFNKVVKEIAFSQIDQIAFYEILDEQSPKNISVTKKEIKEKNIQEIAKLVSEKINILKYELKKFNETEWEQSFKDCVESKITEMKYDWEDNWKLKCKGKDLLTTIYQKFGLSNYKDFVKSLVKTNKVDDTEEWQILKSKITPITLKQK